MVNNSKNNDKQLDLLLEEGHMFEDSQVVDQQGQTKENIEFVLSDETQDQTNSTQESHMTDAEKQAMTCPYCGRVHISVKNSRPKACIFCSLKHSDKLPHQTTEVKENKTKETKEQKVNKTEKKEAYETQEEIFMPDNTGIFNSLIKPFENLKLSKLPGGECEVTIPGIGIFKFVWKTVSDIPASIANDDSVVSVDIELTGGKKYARVYSNRAKVAKSELCGMVPFSEDEIGSINRKQRRKKEKTVPDITIVRSYILDITDYVLRQKEVI